MTHNWMDVWIGRPPGEGGGGEDGPTSALPRDLVREASRRLSLATLVCTDLLVLGLVLQGFAVLTGFMEFTPGLRDTSGIISAGLVLSLCVYIAARSGRWSPAVLLDLGLLYEVGIGFVIGVAQHWLFRPYDDSLPGVSWLCLLILLFPTIVPNTPGKTLIAALAVANMDVVGIGVSYLRGNPNPTPSLVFLTLEFLPNYVCAFLAIVPSIVIRNLGGAVREARRMGSYELEAKLGSGGMGEVWRARHRLLARPAAIKLIRSEIFGLGGARGSRVAVERFEREAQATAQLHSPHTVQLYDFGTTPNGAFYYVMELLEGLDLETLVGRFGPVDPARAVFLLRQICHSLSEAHGAGLIHRDVKPANVYVCRIGQDYDFIKVLDFGLVKAEAGALNEKSVATTRDTTSGTPAYMAPELALGRREFDGRVDLYALGCIGYWLVTGALVFDAATPVEMLMKHVHDVPVVPSARTEIEVPEALDRLLLQCLSKDPDERPVSAAELLAELEDLGRELAWDNVRARAWWEMHRPEEAASRRAGASQGAASGKRDH